MSLSLLPDSPHHFSLLTVSLVLSCAPRGLLYRHPCSSSDSPITVPGMIVNVLLVIFSHQIIGSLPFVLDSEDVALFEGSQCRLENGENGVCKKLPDCPPRIQEVQQGKRNANSPGKCGFDNFTEIVCCPVNITQKISSRPAEIACQEYNKKFRANTELAFHIFGGVEAQSDEFPYAVALGYPNNEEDAASIEYNCGGSLISPEHVLTAAHCVFNINNYVPVEARLGNIDIENNEENVQRIPISDIIFHPQYKSSAAYNDVAIIKLKTKVQMSDTAKPICLQTKPLHTVDTTSRTSFVVIGWGYTNPDGDKPSKLMRTPSLSLLDKEKCKESFNTSSKLSHGIDDTMICAKDTNVTRKADACQGDSGGPLLMLTESGDTVIGVTSFGSSCGTTGVYTAVHSYLDWIEEQVWPSPGSSPHSPVEDTFLKINISAWFDGSGL